MTSETAGEAAGAPRGPWRRFTAGYARLLEWLLAASIGILILPVTLQIISRFTQLIPHYIWTEEMARFLFIWAIMIGASVAVREASHFDVDVWPQLSRRAEAVVRVLSRLGILALAIVFLIAGTEFTRFAWNRTSELAELPLWLIHIAWPFAGLTWLVFLGEQLWDELKIVVHGVTEPGEDLMSGNVLSAGQAAAILFGVFGSLLVLRVPVAFALGLACLPILAIEPRLSIMSLAQETFNAYNSFILLAVPFFLLTANLMSVGGITDRLVALSRTLVGSWPGSLAQINVVLSVFFAGISGSSTADAASQSKIFIDAQTKEGYDLSFLHCHHGRLGGAGGDHSALDPDDRVGRPDLDLDRGHVSGGRGARPADRRRADGDGASLRREARLSDLSEGDMG